MLVLELSDLYSFAPRNDEGGVELINHSYAYATAYASLI